MHTRIEKDAFFQAGIHFRGSFYVNTYEITLSMLVETFVIREQAIAMERLNHFLTETLQHSLLIQNTEKDSIENYKKAGLRICQLPEEPLDQIIGMILLMRITGRTGHLQMTMPRTPSDTCMTAEAVGVMVSRAERN